MIRTVLAYLMLSVGILLIPAANCSAQCSQADSLTSIRDGAWALSFGIGPNFTLKTFDGTTVSWKRFISDNSAIRVGVSVNARDMDMEVEAVDKTTEQTHTNTYWDVTLQGHYVRYPVSSSNTRFFWGIGPVVSIHNEEERYLIIVDQDKTTHDRSRDVKQRDVGLSAVLGVEWFPIQDFSLHAEYGQTLSYSWSEGVSDDKDWSFQSTSTREEIQWSPTQVRFGLSVYF